MESLNKIVETFWSTSIWLPPNVTWNDLAPGSRSDVIHANYKDLVWPLPMACVVLLLRYTLERFWIAPIGKLLGIKSARQKKIQSIPLLEKAYQKSSTIDHKKVIVLSKSLNMKERQIERWWRLRRTKDKPSILTKFCENTWRCVYYTYSFCFGLLVLWDKEWFWDIKQCWYGYPHQSLSNDIWWYYMISMSFYWSLTVTQFFDVKRKDFWQMFVHHMVTLVLMSLSWICNLHRVGSLVLVVHDCADIFLEIFILCIYIIRPLCSNNLPVLKSLLKVILKLFRLQYYVSFAAKLTKYAKYQRLCDTIFAIFTIVWIITRLGFYPRIIYSSSIEAPRILPMFPAYYIFNSLLIMLLFLHIIWTYMIIKIVVDSIQKGLMSGDIRSSGSDDISDSSETEHCVQNGKIMTEGRSINHVEKHMKLN